jgi:DNA-directed RNA polymerase II subunit RPB1
MNTNKTISTKNVSKIIAIQFSLLSPEEIVNGSVVEIVSRDTYNGNLPAIGGIFDPRMGVLEGNILCPTDGLNNIQTPGYFGHIHLARPVFYIQFLNTIQKILKCVCFKCSKLLVDKEKHMFVLNMANEQRWKYVFNISSKIRRCGEDITNGCGCLQPYKIRKEGLATLYADWKTTNADDGGDKSGQDVSIKITPEMTIKIFKRMSDDDINFMGFSSTWSRPEWMVCQVLAVPPPAVRPSVKHDAQQRSEDDLSYILINIIKTNKTLQEKIQNNAPENIIDDWTIILQYYIASQIDNKMPGSMPVQQRSGRPLKSLKDRLNGKSGRMRSNLMAKRVDFSARSVITADPNISIRELGIPMKIAKNITRPVVVNERNIRFLYQLIANGPDVYPGAKILERKTGENITLKYDDRKSIVLNNGDIVHRHIMDGDIVIFNRQPTLHRMSMMGHIAKVMKQGDTFRMNVADTKPYNADFDGDEMNLHMPQDIESESELKNLAAVPHQIISPANNAPIIGIYQDSMVGSYLFTGKDVQFDKLTGMNLLMGCSTVDVKYIYGLQKTITNFDILSQIMPQFTTKIKNKQYKDTENPSDSNNIIQIENGKYLRGQLDKGALGSSTKGLIHRVCNDFGNMPCSDFIDNLQSIITDYMCISGFSVGISDLYSNIQTKEKIVTKISEKKKEVYDIIQQTQLGIFENTSGKPNNEEFESKVNNILNKASSEAGNIGLENLNKSNRFVMMVNAGSKGSELNIAQMICCLGQQNVDGKRIPYGFEHRTLPHYTKYDDSPPARGFVESSYISGLSPQELFFHAMGGRVGLIDTAVKTSTTGYIQRRLIKSLEDLMVRYDGTVRTSKDYIVQFSYGDDGVDTIKVENQELRLMEMSIQDIYNHYSFPEMDIHSLLKDILTPDAFKRMKSQNDETTKKHQQYTEQVVEWRNDVAINVFKNKSETIVRVPVSFIHIIKNTMGQQNLNSKSIIDVTPLEAYELIEHYMSNLEKNYYFKPTLLFKILYYYYLSPKDLLFNKRFDKVSLIVLLEKITYHYKKSLIAPGEMVGMIAAQSIGEPTTQLTLNSVTYETEIIVKDYSGKVKKYQIGDFVTEHIKTNKKLEYYEDTNTTYAEPVGYYEIPSCDEDGNVSWKQIEAVTQHPVINKDGTNTMLKITTEEDREIIVTKAKSVLKLINGKIVGADAETLSLDDYLVISTKTMDFVESHMLDLREILPPTEYVYTSEVNKALAVMKERHWWLNHQGTTFTLPYTRSDSFTAKVSEKLRVGCKTKTTFADGCVYPKQTNKNDYNVPEIIPLDYDFGYLVGAYAAEGCMTKFQVSIANNDENYFEPIIRLCEKWNITTKIYRHENKNKEGWTSQDIRLYNTLLCRILENLCGKLSHNKYISDKMVFSNRECMLGFLDAYIGGDGSIDVVSNSIDVSSTSKNMLIDVQNILNNFGIYGYIKHCKKQEKNNRGTLSENIHQLYILHIKNNQARNLSSILNLKIGYKNEGCREILSNTRHRGYEYNRNYLTIPNEVEGKLVFESRVEGELVDVLFDKIKTIEEVSNTTDYAYDLTVADTRNFNLRNGICVIDTFHFAGVASKSNVTRGVQRIEELLSVTSNPKNPSLTIYVNKDIEDDEEKVIQVKTMLEYTILKDIVEKVEICFDPNDSETRIKDDEVLMERYHMFESMMDECSSEKLQPNKKSDKSKWIIRLKMNSMEMVDRNITMDDVDFTLKCVYDTGISCIYSDYNAENLIFRIRLQNISGSKKNVATKNQSLDQTDHIYLIKNFQENMMENIVLRGVKDIQRVMMRKLKDNMDEIGGTFKKNDIWVLDTVGSNLLDVLGKDYVDSTRTFSNDVIEIHQVLGMEATRQTIYNEMSEVLEFDGSYINYHHMALLVDRMTFSHKIVSVFRHGINNDDIGPIAKASFEETPEMFLKAARHGELDLMKGVSANVMVGQEGYYGTSAFQVFLDMNEMIKLNTETIHKELEVPANQQINQLFEEVNSSNQPCSIENLTIYNNSSLIKQNTHQDFDDSYTIF